MSSQPPAFKEHLADPEAFASVLACILTDEFGSEWMEWDPDTLRMEVVHTWQVDIPRVNLDKLNAVAVCITTNYFYKNLETFTQVCLAFNNTEPNFDTFDPPGVSEMAWGVGELNLLDFSKGSDPHQQWDDEIKILMKVTLEQEGFTKVPESLRHVVSKLDLDSVQIDDSLDSEGIDGKVYFDDQQKKIIAVDQYVSSRLVQLLQTLSSLPLRHARSGAQAALSAHVQKALAAQQKEQSEMAATTPQVPDL